jgi:hypothetical protein
MNADKLVALVVCGLVGCGGEDAPPPGPPPSPALVAAVTGRYELTNSFQVPVTALLSGKTADTLGTVRGLRQDPAGTFFSLLEEAGVPHARLLHEALPGILQGRLDGWINDFVLAGVYRDRDVVDQLGDLDAFGARLLLRFDLITELALGTADASGTSTATHTLGAVRFTGWPGHPALTVPALPPALASGITSSPLSLRIAGDARLAAGDHAFGLPLGQYALAALDLALEETYGQDLRGTLALLVSCPAMAAAVSHRCVGPVCVGHEGDLRAVCENGLDEVASEVRRRLLAHDFQAIHFLSGTAAFQAPDRLEAGLWKTNIDVGQGERPVSVTFRGLRH